MNPQNTNENYFYPLENSCSTPLSTKQKPRFFAQGVQKKKRQPKITKPSTASSTASPTSSSPSSPSSSSPSPSGNQTRARQNSAKKFDPYHDFDPFKPFATIDTDRYSKVALPRFKNIEKVQLTCNGMVFSCPNCKDMFEWKISSSSHQLKVMRNCKCRTIPKRAGTRAFRLQVLYEPLDPNEIGLQNLPVFWTHKMATKVLGEKLKEKATDQLHLEIAKDDDDDRETKADQANSPVKRFKSEASPTDSLQEPGGSNLPSPIHSPSSLAPQSAASHPESVYFQTQFDQKNPCEYQNNTCECQSNTYNYQNNTYQDNTYNYQNNTFPNNTCEYQNNTYEDNYQYNHQNYEDNYQYNYQNDNISDYHENFQKEIPSDFFFL